MCLLINMWLMCGKIIEFAVLFHFMEFFDSVLFGFVIFITEIITIICDLFRAYFKI